MKLYWCAFFPFLVVIAFIIQSHMFLHNDVFYLTHAAKSLLAGGKYMDDFFETNPPLILFLYMPVACLYEVLGLSLGNALLIYFFFLSILSIVVSNYLLQKIVTTKSLIYIIITTITFDLLFLSEHQLGQRDFLFFIFTLPYLFSVVLRIENKPLSPYFGFGIGLFAGLGIGLKPFFLMLPILIELYVIYKKRNILAAIRIETIMISGILIAYISSVFYFFPDYIYTILPFVARVYYAGWRVTWSTYFTAFNVLFCFTPILFYFMTRKRDRYSILSTVFLLGLLAFIISFTIPRALFCSHVLPAFSIACILFAILFGQIATDQVKAFKNKPRFYMVSESLIIVLLACMISIIPIFYLSYWYNEMTIAKTEASASGLFKFINQHAPNNTYTCFSSNRDYAPLDYYSNAKYVGLSTFFWWEYGFIKLTNSLRDPAALQQLKKDESLVAKLITNNLIHKKPNYILIHEEKNIDFVAKFLRYKPFKKAWKHYHYLTTIESYRIYELLGV
jgi:hypothetical protein